MKLIFSEKAQSELKILKINPDWVKMTFEHPDRESWGQNGEKIFVREFEKHLLEVHVKSKSQESIITHLSYAKKLKFGQKIKARFEKFRRSGLIRRFLRGVDVD